MTPNELRTEVLIVGAGPGGCAASITLAGSGVDHLLVDRHTFPRDKVCGDALSGKVMRTLERIAPELLPTLRADARQLPSWGVTFTAPDGGVLRVPFSRTTGMGDAPGSIMPRIAFDEVLFRHAASRPQAQVLQGVQLRDFQRKADGWAVRDPDGRYAIQAKWVVAADGANSHFARHIAGIPLEPRHHCAGVRAYFSGVEGLDTEGFIELIFLKELLPAYLWIFPLPGGAANVGLGLRSDMLRKKPADLKALLKHITGTHPRIAPRFHNARMQGSVQGLGLPLASKRWPLSGDGYFLIGDAGHLIDPFTGEGISHAMISGAHAANVVAEMLRGEATSPKDYDTRVWKRLGKELAISSRLQQLAGMPWLFNLVVGRAVRNPALADTISSMFNDLDMRERLKKPSFYASLLFGRAPRP